MYFSEAIILAFLALTSITSARSSPYKSPDPFQPNNYSPEPAAPQALIPQFRRQSHSFPPSHHNYARNAYPEAYPNPNPINTKLVEEVVKLAGENLPEYISALEETYKTFHSHQATKKPPPSQRRDLCAHKAYAYASPDPQEASLFWDIAKDLPEIIEAGDRAYTTFHDGYEARKQKQKQGGQHQQQQPPPPPKAQSPLPKAQSPPPKAQSPPHK